MYWCRVSARITVSGYGSGMVVLMRVTLEAAPRTHSRSVLHPFLEE